MTPAEFRSRGSAMLIARLFFVVASLLLVACSDNGDPMSTQVSKPTEVATTPPPATATMFPTATPTQVANLEFDGANAFVYLEAQMAFGPRWPGSEGNTRAGDYIVDSLEAFGWQVEEQQFPCSGIEGRNIIGRTNQGQGSVIILGAHYDTRKVADQT